MDQNTPWPLRYMIVFTVLALFLTVITVVVIYGSARDIALRTDVKLWRLTNTEAVAADQASVDVYSLENKYGAWLVTVSDTGDVLRIQSGAKDTLGEQAQWEERGTLDPKPGKQNPELLIYDTAMYSFLTDALPPLTGHNVCLEFLFSDSKEYKLRAC